MLFYLINKKFVIPGGHPLGSIVVKQFKKVKWAFSFYEMVTCGFRLIRHPPIALL
jgi:hypothetical protein